MIERTAHKEHKTVRSAFTIGRACPECGVDPASILAARPLGLEAEPPSAVRPAEPAPQQDVRRLRGQLARAREEVERLESALETAAFQNGPPPLEAR